MEFRGEMRSDFSSIFRCQKMEEATTDGRGGGKNQRNPLEPGKLYVVAC